MTETATFTPKWASPPGETIADLLEERSIEHTKFAKYIGYSVAKVQDLLDGKIEISKPLARQLSSVVGGTEDFWLRREAQFREGQAQLVVVETEAETLAWLKSLPVKYMRDSGWISASNAKEDLLKACFKFFGVRDVAEWKRHFPDMLTLAAYRTSPTFVPEIGPVAAWLRHGEREAEKINCKAWNKAALVAAIPAMKALIKVKDPKIFLPKLRELCAEVGIALVIAKTPPGCPASGAAKLLREDKALILMSFRYLSDDHFWFSFFHEVGHLVLHAKKGLFLEEVRANRTITDEEKEANEFSSDVLIPKEIKMALLSLPLNKFSIARAAVRAGVSPGIIVGHLQHIGRVDYGRLNAYKRRYKWDAVLGITHETE